MKKQYSMDNLSFLTISGEDRLKSKRCFGKVKVPEVHSARLESPTAAQQYDCLLETLTGSMRPVTASIFDSAYKFI